MNNCKYNNVGGLKTELFQIRKQRFKFHWIFKLYFSGFAAFKGANNSCCFKLIYQSAGTVIAKFKSSLQ